MKKEWIFAKNINLYHFTDFLTDGKLEYVCIE